MAKAYSPKEVEARLYAFWEERGWFAPSANNGKEPFCIIMPPPNVTGELHLGHALVATISDALVRWHRMRGEPTLWLPGEDHASIAAQWVMEQELAKQGQTRQELGREGFLKRMWEWMDKYRHIITDQHKTLGASCDWSRERFTMDPGPTKAVLTSFVSYYDQGLVYRGNRIINWCPRCGTALSDLEVDHEEDAGALYYVRYPVLPEGERTGPDYVTVATTRPETIPGDVAVAVNPDDPRFKGPDWCDGGATPYRAPHPRRRGRCGGHRFRHGCTEDHAGPRPCGLRSRVAAPASHHRCDGPGRAHERGSGAVRRS